MTLVRVLALTALVPLFTMAAPENSAFDLKVTRVRTLRDQPGDLHIDGQGIAFRSADGKTSITIAMKDLRDVDVADAHALRFGTYEIQKWKPMERVEYTFRAPPDTPVEELGKLSYGSCSPDGRRALPRRVPIPSRCIPSAHAWEQ